MSETIEYQNIHENRKYKDSLFLMVFREKKHLLNLYNAMNGTSYANPEELEINTLENVLYISMKNDVSFIIDERMNLYEHQSSKNENMPLRGFLYFARLYENYIEENNLDVFNSKLQKLPTPKYVVFFNGTQNEPDQRILHLSDAFVKEGGCLECEATLLNINYGKNQQILEQCKRLEEYSIFVATVRRYEKSEANLRKAITAAMNECIEKGILQDILTKQRNEVLDVVLETFNKELYEKNLKANAYEDGYEEGMLTGYQDGLEKGISEGIQQGIQKGIFSLIQAKLEKGKSVEEIADALEESVEMIQQIIDEISAD